MRPTWGLRSSERAAKGEQWKLMTVKPGLAANPDGVASETIVVVVVWR